MTFIDRRAHNRSRLEVIHVHRALDTDEQTGDFFETSAAELAAIGDRNERFFYAVFQQRDQS